MKNDVKSNYVMVEGLAAASRSTGDANTGAVDMSLGRSASFMVSVGSVGVAGTLAAKMQHSADGSTDWTDEVSGAGNSTAITTITAAGNAVLHVVNPRRRYYRVLTTVGVNAVVYGVIGAHGPLNSVDAG